MKNIYIDPAYSTTRLVIQERPVIENKLEDKYTTVLILPKGEGGRQGEGGLRTQDYFKRSLPGKPLIAVITVVFNGEQYLEETILSVIGQTYDNVEYIIIDGGSTDGTLDIIHKYEHAIDYWVSEKDEGIYDAMNKGMVLASGQWINFMNAGDSFVSDIGVLQSYDANKTPMVYGDALVVDFQGKILYSSGRRVTTQDLFDSMPICHQAIFYSRHFILPYENRYKIIADRVMTVSLMRSTFFSEYDNRIQIRYIEGGVSNQLRSAQLREEAAFLSSNNRLTIYLRLSILFRIYAIGPLYDILKKIGLIRIYRAVKYGF